MSIDEEFLSGLRRYEDPERGFSEEFLEARFGGNAAVGILSRPLAGLRETGWVVCSSLGSEQANLRRLEGIVARELAAHGSPALRIRSGADGTGAETAREVRLAVRLEEVQHAAEWLLAEGGVRRVGLLGALFGGTVAMLACERLGLDLVVLWEPVYRGKHYLREALRFRMISSLLQAADGARPDRGADPNEELAETGSTTVRGLRLTREAYDEIAAVDLTADVRRFQGQALLVSVSPTGTPSAGLERFARHLQSLGAAVDVEALQDPLLVPFGEHYYRNVGIVRIDARLELDQKIATATERWAARAAR